MQTDRPGVLSAGTAALVQAGLTRVETGFGSLLEVPLHIEMEVVSLEAPAALAGLATRPEELVAGVYVAFAGDLCGHCLLCLDAGNEQRLVQRLLGPDPPAALADSALLEVGNITVSGLVNGVADGGDWRIQISPPALARDRLGSLINSVLEAASLSSRKLLAVRAGFHTQGEAMQGTVLLMPDAVSLAVLLQAGPV